MSQLAKTVLLFLLCAAFGSAQTADAAAAAKILSLNGQVSVLKDRLPWALQVGDTVQPKQVIVTGADGYAVLQVADGSTFEVFPNSQVTFRANPGNWRDLLDLWLGRVKVHIQKLGAQPNPNKITTPTAVISVRGTTFDVVVEDQDDTTLIAVEEGQVAVQHALLPASEPKVVSAGETLRVYRNQPLADRSLVDKGAVAQRVLRALADALYTVVNQGNRVPGGSRLPGGGSTGGGAPLPGDTGGTPPPPPPPPPSTGPN